MYIGIILAILILLLVYKIRVWWKSRLTEEDIDILLDNKKNKNNKK